MIAQEKKGLEHSEISPKRELNASGLEIFT